MTLVHRGVQALVPQEGIEGTEGATHLMRRFGASVQIAAVVSVVNIGRAAVPTVTGSERVRIVVAVAESETGHEPRKEILKTFTEMDCAKRKIPPSLRLMAEVVLIFARVRGEGALEGKDLELVLGMVLEAASSEIEGTESGVPEGSLELCA